MDEQAQINGWLVAYGNRTGKIFRLNERGVFAAVDDAGQEYVVDIPHRSSSVYFCAPIAALNDPGSREQDLQCCLQWNLYGQETYGGTLSFEPQTSRIIFHRIFPVHTLDEFSFSKEFDQFILTVKHIQTKWQEYKMTNPGGPKNDMEAIMNNPFLRV